MGLTPKEKNAVLQIYRELYTNSTPSADFDKLKEEAEIDNRGEKIIPFWKHTISEGRFNQIVKDNLPKRMPKHRKEAIKTGILLGVSPKFENNG